MADVDPTRMFQASADAYDHFMGRYSYELAPAFADFCLPTVGRMLDVGCGPGALTAVALARLGPTAVVAVDPSPGYAEACRQRHPGVEVHCAPAEQLPFADDEFDSVAAQLVFHFVNDPTKALGEMARVTRPGGIIAAAVWDSLEGMQMLTAFWEAARTNNPETPEDADVLRFGRPGELASQFRTAGLEQIAETIFRVRCGYQDFDELWAGFGVGVGPAGAFLSTLSSTRRARIRDSIYDRLGQPAGPFTLEAVARVVRGKTV